MEGPEGCSPRALGGLSLPASCPLVSKEEGLRALAPWEGCGSQPEGFWDRQAASPPFLPETKMRPETFTEGALNASSSCCCCCSWERRKALSLCESVCVCLSLSSQTAAAEGLFEWLRCGATLGSSSGHLWKLPRAGWETEEPRSESPRAPSASPTEGFSFSQLLFLFYSFLSWLF